MALITADDGTVLDIPARQLLAHVQEAFSRGIDQIGKPLSVSIGGRSVSYGSAAEAFQAVGNMIKAEGDLLELQNKVAPFIVSQVVR